MLAQSKMPAAHGGEAQASNVFALRGAHWASVAVGLHEAARKLADEYLQDERDDPELCLNAGHHQVICNLFNAIKRADTEGMATACEELRQSAAAPPIQLWSVTSEEFSTRSLVDLIRATDWLQPGDAVFLVETPIIRRHVLTDSDFNLAAARAVIGGAQ